MASNSNAQLLPASETLLADAITARDMDTRSVDVWKLCARVALAGGAVDTALDCLHEALHIDHNDREAVTLLENIVDEHLNETLELRNKNDLLAHGAAEQSTNRIVSLEGKLVDHIQLWSSLKKQAASERLNADQIAQNKPMAVDILNRIGSVYNRLREYRWALACHFLSFHKSRYCMYVFVGLN